MESSLWTVLTSVRPRIFPTPNDRARMARVAREISEELRKVLDSGRVDADVSVQGSYARDTWLREEADLDVFARFPASIDRKDWTGRFLPAIRKGFGRYRQIERFAEHPYLELWVRGIRVNIVPCYDVQMGKWRSATDRTPYHTEYMRANLTGPLRDEARLLKRFAKGVGVYGAEIRVGGFSGMLVDTLLLRYQSFVDTLRAASEWQTRVFIDVVGRAGGDGGRRFESGFVVVDPVDPGRNLAAAVRGDKLWAFVAAARGFLELPQVAFFFPPKPKVPTRREFLRRLASSGHDLVAIVFSHRSIVPDILWGQLFRLERSLVGLLGRQEFRVIRSEAWSDEKGFAVILLEVERAVLSASQLHIGPPVSRKEESQRFLQRHLGARDTIRGPWLAVDRWAAMKARNIQSVEASLRAGLKDSNYGLVIPDQLRPSFSRSVRVMVNEEVVRFISRPGFAVHLWRFLDGKPDWLKKSRS